MNHAERLIVGAVAAFASCIGTAAHAQPATTQADSATAALLDRAFDWQLAQLPTERSASDDRPTGWIRSPFYEGALSLYHLTGNAKYLDALQKIAAESHYDLDQRTRKHSGLPDANKLTGAEADAPYDRFADDLAVGQFYAELYAVHHDEKTIAPLRARLDHILAEEPIRGREDWWWCDALYMAPATFSHLFKITGDRKYLDFADKQFWDTTEFLYNKDEHLYFRDKSFFTKTEANGKPVFWSRGNGWVLAGTARFLVDMPADYPTRDRHVQLFQEMSEKIASLQQSDGFWRVSLLDPDSYPGGETSGTGFYCYALAWGINNNLLPRGQYLPTVRKAWAALATTVDPATGQVGWVQPVGLKPVAVKQSNSAEFGTGAVLLAGTEVLKLDGARDK